MTNPIHDAVALLTRSINLRDLGGLPTTDGRQTRHGLLFRSAEPRRLDEASLAALDRLGIRVVCDMRSERERHHRPVGHSPYARARLITGIEERSNADLWSHLDTSAACIDEVRATMVEVYRRLPEAQGPLLPDVVDAIAAHETPLLFHCAAGKDRTGFLAAILLSLLGVEEEAIMADYAATDPWMGPQREAFMAKKRADGRPDSIWAPLFQTDAAFLHTALDTIRARSGSIEVWALTAGVTPDRLEAARRHMLEPA